MSKLRFQITMSVDGYVAGPNQSVTNPLGEGGFDLHKWAFETKSFREMKGMEGGATGAGRCHLRGIVPEQRRDHHGPLRQLTVSGPLQVASARA